MYRESIEQKLSNYLQLEVKDIEPPREWWDDVISKLGDRKLRQQKWFVPKTRLAWVLLPLVLLLLAGTAYAASTVIQELFQRFAGHIEKAGLVQELNISQTIDGITVSLERAYADSNVVLLGYTVSGPDKKYNSYVTGLLTEDGQNIPELMEIGTVPGSEAILGEWGESERLAIIAAFNSSAIQAIPSELNLKLEIQVAEVSMFGVQQRLTGPFILKFSLPFNTGNVVEVNQTVEAAGIPITLEKVEISPWVTQVVVQFHPPYDSNNHPVPIITLELPAGNPDSKGFMTTPSGQYFLGDFTSEHGEGIVTIRELVLPPDKSIQQPGTHPASDTERVTGPWIFRFQIP